MNVTYLNLAAVLNKSLWITNVLKPHWTFQEKYFYSMKDNNGIICRTAECLKKWMPLNRKTCFAIYALYFDWEQRNVWVRPLESSSALHLPPTEASNNHCWLLLKLKKGYLGLLFTQGLPGIAKRRPFFMPAQFSYTVQNNGSILPP